MRITPDVIRHELIGTEVKVAGAINPQMRGLSGKIIDETRNTLTVQRNGRKRIVAKKNIFHLRFSDGTVVEIDGRLLIGRPEDRLKKSIRRLW